MRLMVVKHPFQEGEVVDNGERVECEKCGKSYGIGAQPFCPHEGGAALASKQYPFVTKNFDGTPIEVTSAAHEKALMEKHGVVKRDDVGWVEKEYLGYNVRTGKHEYKEGRGVGLPGCWV